MIEIMKSRNQYNRRKQKNSKVTTTKIVWYW